MSAIRRDFGQPPALKDVLPRAKEFTDMAMNIEIDDILDATRTVRGVGHTAAHMSGARLQLEGDGASKRIVAAAYESIYDVITPSLHTLGPDAAQELFKTDATHATLTALSRTMDSYQFSKLTHRYLTTGAYLTVDESGLVQADDFRLTPAMEARRGGCPYARNNGSSYFNRFTDNIVDTYAEAHRRDLPHGWLGVISRSLQLR